MRRLALYAVVLFAGVFSTLAFAQAPAGGRGPAPAPTNLKVLTPENLNATMFSIVGGLGVRCDFCHNMADRASDEKPEKLVARKMLMMVKNINEGTFNGDQKVSCWTCHRGEQKPAVQPPAPARGGAPAGGPPAGGPGR